MEYVAHRGYAREFPENTLTAFRGGAELTFAAVMLVLGSLALGGWRALYFRLR